MRGYASSCPAWWPWSGPRCGEHPPSQLIDKSTTLRSGARFAETQTVDQLPRWLTYVVIGSGQENVRTLTDRF